MLTTQGFAENANITTCTTCDRKERFNRRNKTVYVGSDGWPIVTNMNRPFKTFIKKLIYTKKKVNYGDWLDAGHCKIEWS